MWTSCRAARGVAGGHHSDGRYQRIYAESRTARADAAEQRLIEERKRHDERIDTLINEQREERRVMMSTIAELTGAIAELRRQNSGSDATGG